MSAVRVVEEPASRAIDVAAAARKGVGRCGVPRRIDTYYLWSARTRRAVGRSALLCGGTPDDSSMR